jgi:hypothetical protein
VDLNEIESARSQLADAGLVLPPIPEQFRTTFRKFGDWSWGTRELDRLEMYMFRHFANDRETETRVIPPDYMALSHGGHGSNSYFLTYHLVYRPIAIFFQIGWGGVYMDDAVQARIFNRHCALATQLVELAATCLGSGGNHTKVGLVECSPARSIANFTAIESPSFDLQPRAPIVQVREESDGALAVYAQGIAWLRSEYPSLADTM